MIKRYLEQISGFIENNRFSGLAVAGVFYLLIVIFCFTRVYEVFELKLYDLRFSLRPSIEEWDGLYFLDIDENSLTTVGQFPWPRNIYGEGLKTLADVGAGLVSFDIMFPDASPRGIDNKELDALTRKAAAGSRITPTEVEAVGVNKDRQFADGVKYMNRVILAYTFNDEPLAYDVLERQKSEAFIKAKKRFTELASVKVSGPKSERLKSLDEGTVKSISYPIPELMTAARSFGFVNRYTDIDGVIRKVQLVRVFEGRLYFNLALVMLMDASQTPMSRVEVIPGRHIILRGAHHPLSQKVEDITIPIDDKGMMYVTWAGSGKGKEGRRERTFHLVPFYALLEYEENAEFVRGLFDEEDARKANELAGLQQQLDGFTEELGGADAETKKMLSAGMEEVNRKIAAATANPLLADLEKQMKTVREEYGTSGAGPRRAALWKRISALKKKMNRTRLEYLGNYDKEITAVKKELKQTRSAALGKDLKNLEYARTAMDLAIRVEDLSDRITLTGLTATGTQDIGAIPLHNEYARVGTYHNTINTIVQKQFISRVNWPLNLLLMLVIALGMGYVIKRLDAKRSLVTMLVTFILLNLAVMLVFALFNVWMQQLGIVLSMFLPSSAIVAIKFMREENQKRFIKNAFSFYLSPTVIDEIIKDPESLELGGEDREITIFFSDIKGFSTISEKLTPQDLVKRLNEYLTEMTDVILKYNGTVDKYIGDAIMAFYGAPVLMPDHATKACMAAVDMKKRLRELQETWRKAGLEPIFARMGIHSGKATVGNMGSRTRMDYTAMGDAVNLASRLEGANKSFDTAAMISGSTFEAAKESIEARILGKIRVVGKSESVPIYELLGMKAALPDYMYDMLEKYNAGRSYFIKRDWKQAISYFRQAIKVLPDDGPSRVYVEKCEEYMKSPPPRGWDGVFVLKSK
ncbi:MAG TPA: CHASE2 domain-containing protein [Spirochaetota bacterium]|nr:CHASE2 domain-containing protein [Spirochaetota bacterium]HOD13245.1 CHASE2 domain-containing protein [Spirochaetota bacterium]HPG48947.1 CHASE2 domain-containing protein [Spirochaetota bacterium]HPN10456.1 CHASE2 domain-containing protein [Spirochaetota bacterium]HQL81762.1 CHASE2 domain-containing protein [Spirochaetota bacterium]